MTPTKTGRSVQIGVRLEHALAARVEKVAQRFSRPGLPVNKSDVIRMALIHALPAFERERRQKPQG